MKKPKKEKIMSKSNSLQTANAPESSVLMQTAVKSIETVILLLGSCETEIVSEALNAMDKFSAKSEENLIFLSEHSVVQSLYSLEDHSNQYINWMTLKILGKLCSLANVRETLLRDESYLPHYVNIFVQSDDVKTQEFSSLILAQLTKEHYVCDVLVKSMSEALLKRVSSSDPDVVNNTLQIIANILEKPLISREFACSPFFTFVPLLKLIHSEYSEIQHLVIQVIHAALSLGRDQTLHQEFVKCGGFNTLMEVLELHEWRDIHGKILSLLEMSADTIETAQVFFQTGPFNRLSLYMETICDTELVEGALAVIVKIAKFEEGCQALHEAGIVARLCSLLQESKPSILTMVCQALPLMSTHTLACNMIMNSNPFRYLTAIIQKNNFPSELQITASYCLSELTRLDKRACTAIVEFGRHELLICLLQLPFGELPLEMSINLVMILRHLSVHPDIREKVLESAVVNALLTCVQGKSIQLTIPACYALLGYLCEKSARDAFLLAGGERNIMECLKNQNLPLSQAAALLIQATACDSTLAKAFIHAGALQWLLTERQKGIGFRCPSCDSATDALLNHHLPSKFAYQGRLDLHNVTTDGFYAAYCLKQPFPILEQLLLSRVSPIRPIYVVNFALPDYSDPPEENATTVIKTPEHCPSDLNFSEMLTESFGKCASDTYLPHYLVKLQAKFAESDKNLDRMTETLSVVERRAKILAEFVCAQLCGADPNGECNRHTLELHLNDLKVKLGSNVIPLGYLRVGLYFERALLFKVLADRVGLPCALVRGEYGRTWIELALPHYPLRPNLVVDLMFDTGTLMPLGTYEANKYCNVLS